MLKRNFAGLTLVLIRHGETLENAKQIVQGQMNGSLSEKGREEVSAIAARLKEVRPDAVYSSDLERASETAESLIREGVAGTFQTDRRLREQGLGIYEGQPVSRLLRRMKAEGADHKSFRPEGGEEPADFRIRIVDFIDELKARHVEETVLLVTHFGWINVLMDHLSLSVAVDAKGRDRYSLNSYEPVIVKIGRDGSVTMDSLG